MERKPSKPALITPSASPPVFRSFFPPPYRIPDSSPPSKRQRLSSTSRPPQPYASSPSTSSIQADQPDFNHEREASTLRMLDVWSHLAERYTRRLDEDDIIDITTGDFIKDRGVLRNSPKKYKMGCFVDPDEPEPSDSGVGEGDGEDDVDELDAFAGGGETVLDEERDVVVGGRSVPPVRVMDPADAEDLREFMEAERRRREECGSEGEEEESDAYSGPEAELEDVIEETRTEVSRGATEGLGEDEELEDEIDADALHLRPQPPSDIDSGSDDELGGWDADEGNTIYRIPKANDYNDDEEGVEIVEPPLHPAPSSPTPPPPTPSPTKSKPNLKSSTTATRKSTKPKTKPKPAPLTRPSLPPHQLQTPPQSHSSSVPSSTPEDLHYYTLPPSSRYSRYDSDTPTRPRSRSLTQRPSLLVGDRDTSIPRLDLAQMVRSKPGPKAKTKTAISAPTTPIRPLSASALKGTTQSNTPRSKSGLKGKERDEQGIIAESSTSTQTLRRRETRAQTKVAGQEHGERLRAEVVIVQPRRSQSRAMGGGVEVVESDVGQDAVGQARKEKGKAKGRYVNVEEDVVKMGRWEAGNGDVAGWEAEEEEETSDDPIMLSSSPISNIRSQSVLRTKLGEGSSSVSPSHSGNQKAKRQPKLTFDQKVESSTPAPAPASMGTRKRKRVLSSESVEVTSPVKERKGKGRSISFSSARSGTNELEMPATESGFVSDTETMPKSKTRSTPKRGLKSKSKSSRSDSDSDQDSAPRRSRSRSRPHRRRASPSPPPQPYYPYAQPPYTPLHSHPPQPHFSSGMQDPRAQFIISQAMHQLSSLFTVPWSQPQQQHQPRSHREPWMPFMPTHHVGGARDSSPYRTPTHRSHPYASAYDSAMSGGTAPPSSSPELPSSPIKSGGSGKEKGRAKSLVGRSQSKGRRVSFMIDEGVAEPGRDEDAMDVSASPLGARMSVRRDVSPPPAKGKGKGKEKTRIEDLDAFESGYGPESSPPSRGRRFERGQTPGPPSRRVPSRLATGSGKKSRPDVGDVDSSVVVRGRGARKPSPRARDAKA